MDTLAFITDPAASMAMLNLAEPSSPLREPATWWLLNRHSNDGAGHHLLPALKVRGIYDPATIVLKEAIVPRPAVNLPELAVEQLMSLAGDVARGKETATRCLMCHAIDDTGAEVGPSLDGWARGKSAEVIATAIVRPDAGIAQGYDGTEVLTKDGLVIQGLLIKEGDPLMMRSMGGLTQIIPVERVATRKRLPHSLMMSARAARSHGAGRGGPRGVHAQPLTRRHAARSFNMMSSMRVASVASSAWGMSAGISTMVPATARTGAPPIVRVTAPSSATTRASNGERCSVSPWPPLKAKNVRLPPSVLARMRLAMPPSSAE